MQISLVQTEIEEAIQAYLKNIMTIPANKKFNIEFQVTRSPSGCNANISIVDEKTDPTPIYRMQVEKKTTAPVAKDPALEKAEEVVNKTLSDEEDVFGTAPVSVEPAKPKKTFFSNL